MRIIVVIITLVLMGLMYDFLFISKTKGDGCHFANAFFRKVDKIDLAVFDGYAIFPSRAEEIHPSYWEIKYEKDKGVSAYFNTAHDTVDMVRYNGKPENRAKYLEIAKMFTFLDINTIHTSQDEIDIRLRGKHFLFYSKTKKVFPGNYIIGFKGPIYEIKDSVWFSDFNCRQSK